MLRTFDNISDALAKSAATDFPLLVIVHAKLHTTNHSREATSTETYSFLPYGRGPNEDSFNGSASTFGNAPSRGPISPVQAMSGTSAQANALNASLGLLVTPEGPLVKDFKLGFVQGGSAQREALHITLLESRLGNVVFLHCVEEGTPAYEQFTAVVPSAADSFPRVHLFPPPRRGLQQMVLQKDLLTPAKLFEAVQIALQVPHLTQGPLGGLNPGVPSTGAAGAEGGMPALKQYLLEQVEAMNKERQRTARQQDSLAADARRPLLPGGASAGAGGAAAAGAAATPTAPTSDQVTARDLADARKGRTAPSLHLVHVEGLPRGKKRAIITSPIMTLRTVWTEVENQLLRMEQEEAEAKSLGDWDGTVDIAALRKRPLRLRVGDDGPVVRSAEAAEQIRLQSFPANTAVHVLFEDAPTPTATSTTTAMAAGTGDGGKLTEGEKGTAASKPTDEESTPTSKQTAATTTAAERKDGDDGGVGGSGYRVVCEGDVCRRVPVTPPPPTASAKKTASTANEEESGEQKAKETPSTASPTSAGAGEGTATVAAINIRCSLPDGHTETVSGLSPATQTLRDDVRPVIVNLLGHSSFVFVRPYPPKRFSVDEDEGQTLLAVGLSSSSALRVVLTGDAPAAPHPPRTSTKQSGGGDASGVNPSPVRQFLGRFFGAGRGGAPVASPPSSGAPLSTFSGMEGGAAGGGRVSSTTGGRGGFHSMAEIRASQEEQEREHAREELQREQQLEQLQRLQQSLQQQQQAQHRPPGDLPPGEGLAGPPHKRKVNRYFGGDSTEYIAPADPDSGEADSGEDEAHQGEGPAGSSTATATTAPPVFTGPGRRLADGARVVSAPSGAGRGEGSDGGRAPVQLPPLPGSSSASSPLHPANEEAVEEDAVEKKNK